MASGVPLETRDAHNSWNRRTRSIDETQTRPGRLLARTATAARRACGRRVRRGRLRGYAARRDRLSGLQRARLGAAVRGRAGVPGPAGRPGLCVGLRPDPGRAREDARGEGRPEGDPGAAPGAADRNVDLGGAGRAVVPAECCDPGRGGRRGRGRGRARRGHPLRQPGSGCAHHGDRRPSAGAPRRRGRPLRPPAPRGDHHPTQSPHQPPRRVADLGGAVCRFGYAVARHRCGARSAGRRHRLRRDDAGERQRADLGPAPARGDRYAHAVAQLPARDEGHTAPADRGGGRDRAVGAGGSWARM